jgi:hypothetical protein
MKRIPSVIILFFACLFVLLQSTFTPGGKEIAGMDASAYIYAAKVALDGGQLYKDVVDHKGPFLYLVNILALGLSGGRYIGIWFAEVLSLFVASLFMYKTARLYAAKSYALVGTLGALLFICPLLTGGDVTEEWALPFISMAAFIFTNYLKNTSRKIGARDTDGSESFAATADSTATVKDTYVAFSVSHLAILAVCFVLVFLTKPTLVAAWGGFGAAVLLKWILEKQFREMFRCLGLLAAFSAAALIPFFLYFYFTNTLSEAWYCIFQFNLFEYKFTSTDSVGFLLRKNWLLLFVPFLGAAGLLFSKKDTCAGVFLALLTTAFACSLGGGFGYYLIVLAPLFAVTLAYFYERIVTFPLLKSHKTLACVAVFFVCNLFPFLAHFRGVWHNYTGDDFQISTLSFISNDGRGMMDRLKDVIEKHSSPDDTILVRGYATYVYLHAERKCAGRFPYPLIGSSWVNENYAADAAKNKPRLIIQGNGVRSVWDLVRLDSLLNSDYKQLESGIADVEVWQRK